jgi:hypothetical protein
VVIALLTGLAAVSALLIALFRDALPGWAAICLFGVWGAEALSFYGIAVAHMADRAEHGQIERATVGLVFVWAAGSVAGPAVQGAAVDIFRRPGNFLVWRNRRVAADRSDVLARRRTLRANAGNEGDFCA